jgi:hypothetical protein
MRSGVIRFILLLVGVFAPTLVSAQASGGADPRTPQLWTGPYFGLTLGTGGADLQGPGGATGSQDGRETSIYGGFSWVRGATFYAVEYDLTVNLGRDTVFGEPVPVGSREAAVDWMTSLRGRYGIIREGTLVYATAGLVYSDTVSTGRSYDTGAVFGGGVEQPLSELWSLRGEALFYRFDPSGKTDRAEVDDAWVVRIGITRRF